MKAKALNLQEWSKNTELHAHIHTQSDPTHNHMTHICTRLSNSQKAFRQGSDHLIRCTHLTAAIMMVRQLPPSESFKSRVNLLSRYGIWPLYWEKSKQIGRFHQCYMGQSLIMLEIFGNPWGCIGSQGPALLCGSRGKTPRTRGLCMTNSDLFPCIHDLSIKYVMPIKYDIRQIMLTAMMSSDQSDDTRQNMPLSETWFSWFTNFKVTTE